MRRCPIKKRILLIYAVDHRFQNVLNGVAAPSGLSWIASSLEMNGLDHKICDLSLIKNQEELERLLQVSIDNYAPHAIGVSIRNIDTSSYPPFSFIPFLKKVTNKIKKLSNVPIILGGSGFSLKPEYCLKELKVKYGIVGEGEESFPILLDSLFREEVMPSIPGLVLFDNGNIKKIPRKIMKHHSNVPRALHREIDYKTYQKIGGYFPIQSKRGCSFQCIYCDYPYLEGRNYRLRDPKNIVDEIEDLINSYSLRSVFFTDSVFNYPSDYCASVLEEIIRRKLNITWTAYVNPRGMTNELIGLFKKSGCSKLEVTIDSASNDVLRSYQKGFTFSEIKKLYEFLAIQDIPTFYWVNLGGPGETEETLEENFKNLSKLKYITKGWLGVGFVAHPNTSLHKLMTKRKRGESDNPKATISYLSPFLPKDYAQRIQIFCLNNPVWSSVYDVFDDEYMKMSYEIMMKKLRDHWTSQEKYGLDRKNRYAQGAIEVISHEVFLKKVQGLFQSLQ